jgi:hypothetical protein
MRVSVACFRKKCGLTLEPSTSCTSRALMKFFWWQFEKVHRIRQRIPVDLLKTP